MGNPDFACLQSIFKNNNTLGCFKGLVAASATELVTLHVLAYILNEPSWWISIGTPEIVQRWLSEMSNVAATMDQPSLDMDMVISLARHLADTSVCTLDDGSIIVPGPVVGTLSSSNAIPMLLQARLVAHTRILEDIPEEHKDWLMTCRSTTTMGTSDTAVSSDKNELSLVHPSLFCLYYNHTMIKLDSRKNLQRMQPPWSQFVGSGNQIARVPNRGITGPWLTRSLRFQWLPSEVVVSPSGVPTITSYINNLHPSHHSELYQDITDIFQQFIPLFEKQVSLLMSLPSISRLLTVNQSADSLNDLSSSDSEESDDVSHGSTTDTSSDSTNAPHTNIPKANVSFKGRRLQIIIKLSQIHVSPNHPEYIGEQWCFDGNANEAIVATGIYAYDVSDMVTPPTIEFRSPVTPRPENRSNNAAGHILDRHGLAAGSFTNQDLGNPSKTIVSTAAVPPQQIGWVTDAMSCSECIPQLPNEVLRLIAQYLPGVVTASVARSRQTLAMHEQIHIIGAAINSRLERRIIAAETDDDSSEDLDDDSSEDSDDDSNEDSDDQSE
ncbi:hypothetical protein BDEG_23700 [Batrachochytrium dendrobatidis JEL423]|uniref:DUF4246 domain-containing protein n=1 Tax=Batrachochytrium dendrobatidis (strain JEL423) TaxID=403673 RepID=A0A177WIK2_BATDL|nr:hypothetical protein BDEG_23700 [Batrachochytrium dendrobatidis JEL423]